MVGLLGTLAFFCSHDRMFTFKDLRRSRSTRWAEHQIIGGKPVPEFVGEESDRVTFSIRFDSARGIPPDAGLPALNKLREAHQALPLQIGPQYFGRYVIESINETHRHHNGFGMCLVAEAEITLREAA